ncbi:MAG: Clp protease N-terminal domain-containing protein, partial [Microgenomates group bacterium]
MNLQKLTTKSAEALQGALELANQLSHAEILPEHLALVLVKQPGGIVPSILEKTSIKPEKVADSLQNHISKLPTLSDSVQPQLSKQLRTVFTIAESEAGKLRDEFVSTEHLLLALLESDSISVAMQIKKKQVLEALKEVRGTQKVTDRDPEGKYQSLEKYAIDFTDLARKGKIDPVIGRDAEIRRITQILSRRTKNNPVLVGEPGTGKTAIVEGLAKKIIDNDVPD